MASGRWSLKVLSLDVVSPVAMQCRGGLRGYGRVSLSEDLDQLPIFWSHLWEGWSPVVRLRCLSKRGAPDHRSGNWKTQTLVKFGSIGAWQAPYSGSWSRPREALLPHGAHAEGHNVSLCPRENSSFGLASGDMRVSPTLKV